jgi:hypothetical protein
MNEKNNNSEKDAGLKALVDKAMHSAGKTGKAELPAFFTDRTMLRIRGMEHHRSNENKTLAWLKAAAVILLVAANMYTLYYIAGTDRRQTQAAGNATLNDFVNEYHPSDSTVVTIENNLNDE